jgi:hypothetical protein
MTAGIVENELDVRPARPVVELVDLVSRLLADNADLLELVALVSIFEGGPVSIQLEPTVDSVRVVVEWAERFGGVLRNETGTLAFGAYRSCEVWFPYDGERVRVYVHLSIDDPDEPAGP